MATPRFQITSAFLVVFVDRLRLLTFDEDDRFFVGASADGRSGDQAPITFDVAKQDAAAYRRAVEAFNTILDEHEQRVAKRNERRRARRPARVDGRVSQPALCAAEAA